MADRDDADDLDSSQGSMRTRRRGIPSASSATRGGGAESSSTSRATAAPSSASSGRASTRSRSPALPTMMSTRGRSPVPPGGIGSASALSAANASSAAAAATSSVRSSGRRSGGGGGSGSGKLVGLRGGGDVVAVAPAKARTKDNDAETTTPIPKRRGPGRPPRSKNSTPGSTPGSAPAEKKTHGKHNDTNRHHGNGSCNALDEDDDQSASDSSNKPLVLLGEKPRGLYECDYCGTDLTRAPRIRCAVCPDFDLCLECFATEDHERMAKYKREEERQKRGDAAKAGVGAGGGSGGIMGEAGGKVKVFDNRSKFGKDEKGAKRKMKAGRPNKGNHKNNKVSATDYAELGSYVKGEWVPYFKHNPSHGYLVADSTRYTLFPSFRGVRGVEVVNVDVSNDEETKKGETDDDEEKKKDDEAGDSGSSAKKEGGIEKEGEVESDRKGDDKDSMKVMEEESKEQEKESSNDNAVDAKDSTEAKEKEIKEKEKEPSTSDAMDIDKEEVAKDGNKKSSDDKVFSDAAEKLGEGDAKKKSSNEEPATKSSDAEASKKDEETCKEGVEKDDKRTHDAEESLKASDGEKPKAAKIDNAKEDDKPKEAAETATKRFHVIDAPKDAWTAEEDLRLLDGILTCGLGNWPDIAEHINAGASGESGNGASASGDIGKNNDGVVIGGKTDKKCMERYLDDFMGRYGHILPPYTMVPVPEGEHEEEEEKDAKPAATSDSSDGENGGTSVASRKRPRRSVSSSIVEDDSSAPGFKKVKFRVVPTDQLEGFEEVWPHPYNPADTHFGEEVARDLWYRSEQSFVRQTTSCSSKADAGRMRKEFIERKAQKMMGYEAKVLPPRLEDMKQLPGAELAGYMPRRGDFDMEWDNDAEKTISEMEFSAEDTKSDRDLKLEVVRIFNRKLDEREKRKQFIIDQNLLNYRENQEKMWKMPPDERHLVQRLRLFARFHDSHEEHAAFVNKILEAKRLRKEIAKLQMYRRLGITSLADAERYEIDKARRELHRNAWLKKEEEKRKAAEEAVRAAKENATGLGIPPPPLVPPSAAVAAGKLDGAIGAAANQSLQVWRHFKRSKEISPEKEAIKESDQADGGNTGNPSSKFVIKDKPGYELLSKKEVGLCKRLRLLPREYLDVKKALISESLAQGIWNPAAGGQKKSIFKIDVTQRDGVIDFVLEAGWIPTRPGTV